MLQLTPRLFVRPANDTIYFTGSDNQFNLAVFFLNMLRCRDLSAASIVRIQTVGHFLLCGNAHAHYIYHVVEVGPKLREFWLSCLRARFAHNVKLVYHQG